MRKGISLVALSITIVILTIMAMVIVFTTFETDIITLAQNGAEDYNETTNKEQNLIEGIQEFISIKLGTNITYIDNVPIPNDFYYVTGTKDTGLVISDSALDEKNANGRNGNQFVWVPVTNINSFALLKNENSTDYRGVLYQWTKDTTGDIQFDWNSTLTSNREPTSVNGGTTSSESSENVVFYDGVADNLKIAGILGIKEGIENQEYNANLFNTQLQTEFNNMVASVKKYKGFYVGRYEVSINNNVAQSKGWTENVPIFSASANTNSANTWYGFYKLCKTYETNSVRSSMLWGCQYDAIIKWIGPEAHIEIGEKRNLKFTCGTAPDDVVNNIYDLYGSRFEWTFEAYDVDRRTRRGGSYNIAYSPSKRISYHPTYTGGSYGSRFTLCIK